MIIAGYGVGILLMTFLGYWELIFISGYSFGLIFTLIKTKLWRRGIRPVFAKKTVSEYSQLSASSGLNNAMTYCDKMLIYPMIGGHSVSVYNSASVVSKMMSIVSIPIRNVLLSYIVDVDNVNVSKKRRGKLALLLVGGTVGLYGAFYLAGVVFCRLLYPKYYAEAFAFIPIILLAILFETYSGFIKIYLLRFNLENLLE
jgi:O-antigen/teichoic acid export membrane protein